jgi:hypothetical protein
MYRKIQIYSKKIQSYETITRDSYHKSKAFQSKFGNNYIVSVFIYVVSSYIFKLVSNSEN